MSRYRFGILYNTWTPAETLQGGGEVQLPSLSFPSFRSLFSLVSHPFCPPSLPVLPPRCKATTSNPARGLRESDVSFPSGVRGRALPQTQYFEPVKRLWWQPFWFFFCTNHNAANAIEANLALALSRGCRPLGMRTLPEGAHVVSHHHLT